jgi:protein-disulfide isomerase
VGKNLFADLASPIDWVVTQRIDELAVPVTSQDHAQGSPDAPLTLLEYGDYECPDCRNALPIVRQLAEEFGPRLRVVFRNFPVVTIHQHASVAAQAAEAAAAQGKFWEMHSKLYSHQQDLATADLSHYALQLGLEIYRFQSDMATEVFAHRVRQDYDGGVRSGVKGTPTFFINGRRYRGPIEYDAMKKVLDATIV